MSTSSDITSEPISLVAGTYDVLEDAPWGWNLADVRCEYDGDSVGVSVLEGEQITVDDGDNVTCTFTNTTRATLIVKKIVINDDGGTATAGDFSFQYSVGEFTSDSITFIEQEDSLLGENHITVDEGSYAVTESAATGYTTSYSEGCDDMELENLEETTCVITNDDIEVPSGGGGNGGDGSNNLGRTDNNGRNGGEVLGASTSTDNGTVLGSVCQLPLTTYMRRGGSNNAQNVMELQKFLNQEMALNPPLPITGFFGPLTEAAVKAFQIKYYDEILKPWVDLGLLPANTATGLVYKTTLWKIQTIGCPGSNIAKPIVP
jgi:peptidoglycan hydrolase-like protein with peptidoglycan-binding domain